MTEEKHIRKMQSCSYLGEVQRPQVFQHAKGQGVLAARMQLPATLLAYNGTGEKLVAAGEDQSILLINIKTTDGNLKACLHHSPLLLGRL